MVIDGDHLTIEDVVAVAEGRAAELGATSADHLICTPEEELRLLAETGTIACFFPAPPSA